MRMYMYIYFNRCMYIYIYICWIIKKKKKNKVLYVVQMILNQVLQSNFEDYIPYLSGAGALVITGVAAYYATRPKPEKPLWPLSAQSTLLPVRKIYKCIEIYNILMICKQIYVSTFLSIIHIDFSLDLIIFLLQKRRSWMHI